MLVTDDPEIQRLAKESKSAIDFFLKLGELEERGLVEVKVVVKRKPVVEVHA